MSKNWEGRPSHNASSGAVFFWNKSVLVAYILAFVEVASFQLTHNCIDAAFSQEPLGHCTASDMG